MCRHFGCLNSQTNKSLKNLYNLLFPTALSTEFRQNTVVANDASSRPLPGIKRAESNRFSTMPTQKNTSTYSAWIAKCITIEFYPFIFFWLPMNRI